VTHGSAFPVCCNLLPQFRDYEVKNVPYCASVIGSLQLTTDEQEFEDPEEEDGGTAETVEVCSILDRLTVNYTNIGALATTTGNSLLSSLSRSLFFTRSNAVRVRSRNKVADILGVALQLELEEEENGTRSNGTPMLSSMKGALVSRSTLKFAGSDLELIEAKSNGQLKVKLVNPEKKSLMSRHHYEWSEGLARQDSRPQRQETIRENPPEPVAALDLEPCESSLLKRRMHRMGGSPDDLNMRF
jgi:hypothetical protein